MVPRRNPEHMVIGHEKEEKIAVALPQLQQCENGLRHPGNNRRAEEDKNIIFVPVQAQQGDEKQGVDQEAGQRQQRFGRDQAQAVKSRQRTGKVFQDARNAGRKPLEQENRQGQQLPDQQHEKNDGQEAQRALIEELVRRLRPQEGQKRRTGRRGKTEGQPDTAHAAQGQRRKDDQGLEKDAQCFFVHESRFLKKSKKVRFGGASAVRRCRERPGRR